MFASIFRSLCALLIGFLLVSNPEAMTPLLVQIIGGLFAAMGLLSAISYVVNRFRYKRALQRAQSEGATVIAMANYSPITLSVALGSVAFGILLIMFPQSFVTLLMYGLGVLLVCVGVVQGVGLISAREVAPLGWSLLLMPLTMICAGVFVVIHPLESAALPFIIMGVAYIFYGIAEFCFGIRIYRYRRMWERTTAAEAPLSDTTAIDFVEAVEVKDDDVQA